MELWSKRVVPLDYKKDRSIKRMLLLLKIRMNYMRDYKNSKWDWK
jgi:hypothetical protein